MKKTIKAAILISILSCSAVNAGDICSIHLNFKKMVATMKCDGELKGTINMSKLEDSKGRAVRAVDETESKVLSHFNRVDEFNLGSSRSRGKWHVFHTVKLVD